MQVIPKKFPVRLWVESDLVMLRGMDLDMPLSDQAREVLLAQEVAKNFYANIIGALAVKYIETLEPDALCALAESEAVKMVCEIKKVLDEDDMTDPECFRRIDSIVGSFDLRHIYTTRHE